MECYWFLEHDDITKNTKLEVDLIGEDKTACIETGTLTIINTL